MKARVHLVVVTAALAGAVVLRPAQHSLHWLYQHLVKPPRHTQTGCGFLPQHFRLLPQPHPAVCGQAPLDRRRPEA